MSKIPFSPINITTKAVAEIQKNLAIKGIPAGYSLRVGIKGSTCAGTYLLGFDKQQATDEVYEIEDITVFINKNHLLYVAGVTLDFEEEGNGFTFMKENDLIVN